MFRSILSHCLQISCRYAALLLAAFIPLPALLGANAVQEFPPPNIVLIIADDLAWDDLGVEGHPTLKTPNIDRLAAEGMRFTHAFLTISSCSPSRASIITGRYPHNTDAEQLHWPVPGHHTTFVQRLRQAGYWTGAAGKWHLGDALKSHFDRIREADTSGFQLPTGAAGAAGKFVETAVGDAKSGCDQWVPLLRERPADQPFFLWLAALDPHRPYDEGILADPTRPEDVVLPPYLPDHPDIRKDMALYYDEIRRLDRFVGEVLAELDRQGVTHNTLVLFISDNGRPFPRDKTTLYDSGIRTPWIVRWPIAVKAGTVCDSLVSSIDIAPTFLRLGKGTPSVRFQGKDFFDLLRLPNKEIRDFVFAEKNWHDYEARQRSVRNPDWKYIRNDYPDLPNTPPADALRSPSFRALQSLRDAGKLYPAQMNCFVTPRPREELYFLPDDPYEMRNLAGDPKHQRRLEKMRAQLDQWQRDTRDLRPETRTPDEFDRESGKPTPARIRPRPSKKQMFPDRTEF